MLNQKMIRNWPPEFIPFRKHLTKTCFVKLDSDIVIKVRILSEPQLKKCAHEKLRSYKSIFY